MAEEHFLAMERRRHTRTQLQMTLRGIRLDPDGDIVDMFHVVDISRGGLGAVVDSAYYPGQKVVMSLPVMDDGGRRNVYATVVRCRPVEDGYHVGLRFENVNGNLFTNSQSDLAAAIAA